MFISGLLNPTGATARLIEMFRVGTITLIVSEEVLSEYSQVFLQFADVVPSDEIYSNLEMIYERSVWVDPSSNLNVCKQEDDNRFLEAAVEGGAEYLITKNTRHFPHKEFEGVRIVKVGGFFRVLEKAGIRTRASSK